MNGNKLKKPIKVKFILVSKEYELFQNKGEKIRSLFNLKKGGNINTKESAATFLALHNITFDVEAGSSVGLIGINGSGKSTLSNILSGIVPPTTGIVEVQGETSIIAIGAGLKNELTGIENIRLKSLMMGKTSRAIEESLADIIEFADIGDFIDQPVKNYSSGMRSRLGFAIAVHTNPDILIIDEALSVGDETFYQKCVEKIIEYKKMGKTIFFVSHSIPQIQLICDKVLWMHYGEIKEFGETSEVIGHYKKFINWFKNLSEVEKKDYKNKYIQRQKGLFDRKENYEDMLNKSLSRKQRKKMEQEFFSLKKKNHFSIASKALVVISLLSLFFLGTLNVRNISFANFLGINAKNQSEVVRSLKKDRPQRSSIEQESMSIESLESESSIQDTERNTIPKITHEVQEGEILEGIAETYHVTVEAIIQENNLTSTVLGIGQLLQIPTKDELVE